MRLIVSSSGKTHAVLALLGGLESRTLERVKIQQNILLAPYTTLGIGGPARFFAGIETEQDLLKALGFAESEGLRVFVLGGGSNLVVPDHGFDGVVLHLTLGSGIRESEHPQGRLFQVDSGVEWDTFVHRTCELGLAGVECLAGIPGLTGASPIQNIGAYGQEVASTLKGVRALDRTTGRFVELAAAECRFRYRSSIFNSTARDRYILTRVDFLLDPAACPNLSYADLASLRGTSPTPLDVYHHVRAIRSGKGMCVDPAHPEPDTRSAGSFFKNPIVLGTFLNAVAAAAALDPDRVPHWPAADSAIKLPAAWLIERAGFLKGFSVGPAAISSRHTLALTNHTGTATAADLFALRDTIRAGVRSRFGIELEQEPVVLA